MSLWYWIDCDNHVEASPDSQRPMVCTEGQEKLPPVTAEAHVSATFGEYKTRSLLAAYHKIRISQ